MAPTKKQQQRDSKHDIKSHCLTIKKTLESEIKLCDEFLKLYERYWGIKEQPIPHPQPSDLITINLSDLDFGYNEILSGPPGPNS